MSKYGSIVIAFLAFGYINAIPIESEYGLPFEVYGPPPTSDIKETHPEVRFDLPKEQVSAPKVTPNIDIRFDKPRTVLPKTIEVIPVDSPIVRTPGAEKKDVIVPPNSHIQIRDEKNQYSVGFQSPDGTEVKEQGRLISTDNGWEYVIAKTGSYKYTSPEGKLVEVEWIADEKGFRILSSTA